MHALTTSPVSTTTIAAALGDARARTLALLEPVPDTDQERQVSELMSPLCWDLAHIGHYEELWLLRRLAGRAPTDVLFDDVYDAFKHPRRERVSLDILDAAAARGFVGAVRERTLAVLDGFDAGALASTAADPLLADGFVYGMVVQHEHQHDETMLATLQLMGDFAHPDAGSARTTDDAVGLPADVLVPGGTFVMGARDEPWAYDNERPAHEVTLAPFRIDTTPVTNAAYAAFVADGGYRDRRHWTEAGWAWRCEAALAAPGSWAPDGAGGWTRRRFGRTEAVPPGEAVQHVCWYEADAFARWSGGRLPSEAEWERAAEGADPAAANLWPATPGDPRRHWGPDPIGTRPAGASRAGAHHVLGDVWEWTSSDFIGYPGFRAFPYREYSEVFFGDGYKVLRGGSWATHPSAARASFRNWDLPVRRQIFAGFRCARDA